MSYLTNCPPCDANFPILCEPLETTAKGKRLVVEDAAACQKTIQTPTGQQILKTDGAGNLSWTNGANDTVLTKSASGVIEFTVISNQIPDGSITTDKLANEAVTAVKLGVAEQTRIAKAWVNFNGTTSPGTILSSYNVSSVTKNGTGNYTVNFTTPMTDANYSVATGLNGSSAFCMAVTDLNPTSVRIYIFQASNLAFVDLAGVYVQIFGN